MGYSPYGCKVLDKTEVTQHTRVLFTTCFPLGEIIKLQKPQFLIFKVGILLSFIQNSNAAAAAAAKSLQSCLTLCDPIDVSPPGSSILGFSRQEHWSGLPFPSPMHESESEVTQSCLTPRDPMACSLLGPSIHGIFQARILEWVAMCFSKTQMTLHLLHLAQWLIHNKNAKKEKRLP